MIPWYTYYMGEFVIYYLVSQDMGFSKTQSEVAIIKHGTVQAAAEALLSGTMTGSPQELDEEVYISDEEDILSETIQKAKTE